MEITLEKNWIIGVISREQRAIRQDYIILYIYINYIYIYINMGVW